MCTDPKVWPSWLYCQITLSYLTDRQPHLLSDMKHTFISPVSLKYCVFVCVLDLLLPKYRILYRFIFISLHIWLQNKYKGDLKLDFCNPSNQSKLRTIHTVCRLIKRSVLHSLWWITYYMWANFKSLIKVFYCHKQIKTCIRLYA